MTNQHPITPPPELVQQWWEATMPNNETSVKDQLCTQAARWGADQELEACCEWLDKEIGPVDSCDLRADRRPKPPSLKEQALQILVENGTTLDGRIELEPEDISIILKALKQLPND
jgi:hypothetical protein